MPLTPYREVLALPGVTRLLLFSVVARVPQIACGIVLTLHVVITLGRGYAAAGLVATASTVGMAIGGPWRGRAIDRKGLRRALVPSVVAAAVVWGSAPFLPFPLLLLDAAAGGLLSTPIFTVARQSLAAMVPVERHRTAYALDSIGVELSFILGPTLGVLAATQLSTSTALLAIAVTSVAAGAALFAFDPPTRSANDVDRPAQAPARSGWFSPALLAVLAVTAAVTIVLTGTDVSIVAILRAHGALSRTGLVFAAWGAGSILGGLVYGALHHPVSPVRLLLALALLTTPVGLVGHGVWGLVAALLPAAALCAPAITSTSEGVSRLVPETVRGEAMGWHGSALTVGTALGAPLAGAMIDARGAWAGFASVGLLGAGLALAGLAGLAVAARRRTSVGERDASAGERDGAPPAHSALDARGW